MENIENSLVSDTEIGKVRKYTVVQKWFSWIQSYLAMAFTICSALELVSYKVRDNLLKAAGVTVLLGEKVGAFLVTALGDLSKGENVCFIHWGQQNVTHRG